MDAAKKAAVPLAVVVLLFLRSLRATIIAGVALAAWLLPDGASGADYRPDSHSRIE